MKNAQDVCVKYAALSLLALEYSRLKLRLIWSILGEPCSGSPEVFNVIFALQIVRFVQILPDLCDFRGPVVVPHLLSHYASLCRHRRALPPILFPFLLCHHQRAIYQLIPTRHPSVHMLTSTAHYNIYIFYRPRTSAKWWITAYQLQLHIMCWHIPWWQWIKSFCMPVKQIVWKVFTSAVYAYT